jgi:hypothetical protein
VEPIPESLEALRRLSATGVDLVDNLRQAVATSTSGTGCTRRPERWEAGAE